MLCGLVDTIGIQPRSPFLTLYPLPQVVMRMAANGSQLPHCSKNFHLTREIMLPTQYSPKVMILNGGWVTGRQEGRNGRGAKRLVLCLRVGSTLWWQWKLLSSPGYWTEARLQLRLMAKYLAGFWPLPYHVSFTHSFWEHFCDKSLKH